MSRRSSHISGALDSLSSSSRRSAHRYVCLQCLHRASTRRSTSNTHLYSPTSTPSLRQSYATQPSIGDKLGWHKKFANAMNKRMWKEGEAPPAPDESLEKPRQKGIPDSSPARAPISLADDSNYTPATSGEGLEMIGGPTGWWEAAWDEEHQFQGFMRSAPLREPGEIRWAVEYALLESVYLAQEPRRFRRLVKNRSHPLDVPDIRDFNLFQKANGEVQLQWKRQEDALALRTYLENSAQVKKNVQATEEGEEAMDAIEAEEGAAFEEEEAMLLEPGSNEFSSTTSAVDTDQPRVPKDWDAPESADVEMEEASAKSLDNGAEPGFSDIDVTPTQVQKLEKAQYKGLQGNISLTDSKFKFSVLKRVMQLTGIRLSDPAIQSIQSSRDLYNELTQKPQPMKLAQILIQDLEQSQRRTRRAPPLTSLPNVNILPKRRPRHMAESALGSKKIIERRLEEHGIDEPFKDVMERIESYERRRLLENGKSLDMEEAAARGIIMEQDTKDQPRAR